MATIKGLGHSGCSALDDRNQWWSAPGDDRERAILPTSEEFCEATWGVGLVAVGCGAFGMGVSGAASLWAIAHASATEGLGVSVALVAGPAVFIVSAGAVLYGAWWFFIRE